MIRPFPSTTPAKRKAEVYRRHREDLISRVGALVVLAGNKVDDAGNLIPSTGVEEEVRIALALGKPVIPVGQSGHVANTLWHAARLAPSTYLPNIDSAAELEVLGHPGSTVDDVVFSVMSLLEKTERHSAKGVDRR